MDFLGQLNYSKKQTNSQICVGLDLAEYGTRSHNTLKEGEKKSEKLIDLVDKLAPYCIAFKINRQYILDISMKEIQGITKQIHQLGRPVIIDHKISDIGSTNQQAIFYFQREGFDAFTASPFPGNVKEICETGHKYGLASIILVLMSNPEAIWMKTTQTAEGLLMYQFLSQEAKRYADGLVVGSTNYIEEDDLRYIADTNKGQIILTPGIGAQGGKLKQVLTLFQDKVIFNVGRAIIYNDDPVTCLQQYNDQVNCLIGK
ncbi:MAG: orotidine 5'-phosphate decarboxylase [Candidatus Heimdallarchaeota archaeon]|nr:orotidine 5'-phosphate decarboxylase [Candidatus Heimdallarchaeota archaeon]